MSRKSTVGTGGVGFEGAIMTGEIAERGSHRKYIPVLARRLLLPCGPSFAVAWGGDYGDEARR